MLPTGNMLKAARALADLTSVELARLAKIDASTISRMETSGARPVRGQAGTVDAVVRALEAKGVVIESDGVRLRKPRRS
jgi:transcriptional regulator with XRE-family HTH domain